MGLCRGPELLSPLPGAAADITGLPGDDMKSLQLHLTCVCTFASIW